MVVVGTFYIVIINVAGIIMNVGNFVTVVLYILSPTKLPLLAPKQIPSYNPPAPLADPASWLVKEITSSPIRTTLRKKNKTQLDQLRLPFRKVSQLLQHFCTSNMNYFNCPKRTHC